MRIKKVSQPTPIIPGTAQITDSYSTSTDDGYSCNYINSQGNEMVVDWTATENTADKTFTGLHILPGESYKFRLVGCATANADIYLRFNGIQSQYYIAARYANGTGTNSDANLTQTASYRPNKTGFYTANHVSTHLSVIDGTISIKYNPESGHYTPFFTWKSQIIWSGHQLISDGIGAYGAASVPEITSLAFTGPTFKAGTRIQIMKVKDDFTI